MGRIPEAEIMDDPEQGGTNQLEHVRSAISIMALVEAALPPQ